MRLQTRPEHHLTYCSNIHPGESWQEVFEQLRRYLPGLKNRLADGRPMGVGLRLSAQSAEELVQPDKLSEFDRWLDEEGLYLFTMNGFPYGSFHRQRVKEQVYAPDWRTPERVAYTSNLIAILSGLLPQDVDGGISTSPLSYKYWMSDEVEREETFRESARNLAICAFEMANIHNDQGKELHLDIEPEPDCLLENSRETIDYFQRFLLPVGSTYLKKEFGISPDEGERILREHIRVCYDTCHFAVEYENPEEAVSSLINAGIKIGKVQISAALRVPKPNTEEERKRIAERLQTFAEPVYLHQVIERRKDGSLRQFRDLPQALPHFGEEEMEEWRIHFHVPIFTDRYEEGGKERDAIGGEIISTQRDILASLPVLLRQTSCRHYEVETYTWEVLPPSLKGDLSESIYRELRWASEQLEESAGRR
ncbi:MAG: metabolite traffic protein EboE [Balneolaceae bacterium]